MNRDAISEYLEIIKNEIKTTTLITTELDRLINTLIDIKKEDDLFVHGLAPTITKRIQMLTEDDKEALIKQVENYITGYLDAKMHIKIDNGEQF